MNDTAESTDRLEPEWLAKEAKMRRLQFFNDETSNLSSTALAKVERVAIMVAQEFAERIARRAELYGRVEAGGATDSAFDPSVSETEREALANCDWNEKEQKWD